MNKKSFVEVKKCGIDFRWNMFGMTEKVNINIIVINIVATAIVAIVIVAIVIVVIVIMIMTLKGCRQLGDRDEFLHKTHQAQHQAKSS